MVNTGRINADHGHADHRTKLQHFTKGEIREFSVSFDHPSNLIVFLSISKKLLSKVAQTIIL